jgi:hypothetical protein
MAVFGLIGLASTTLLLAQLIGVNGSTFLAPEQDIVLPPRSSAAEPLEWAGANSPYYAGDVLSRWVQSKV